MVMMVDLIKERWEFTMSVVRVPVAGDVLRWAVKRSGMGNDRIGRLFPKWDAWVNGATRPTLKQVEDIARATRTPVGFFYLPAPPTIQMPIPDFRRMAGREHDEPSPDLLEVIHTCQLRQTWYREHILSEGEGTLGYVGSATLSDDADEVAADIRASLALSLEQRHSMSTFTDMLRSLRERIEDIGALVFTSGIVDSDTHRTLDPGEFRGFALSDEYAPVVFVNGADTKAAQIFTLMHELAHIWLGSSGLSDVGSMPPDMPTERWCNRVAAEVLVPLADLRERWNAQPGFDEGVRQLARVFKVSTLVILRRLFDAGYLEYATYRDAYGPELERLLQYESRQSSSGGNFYNSALVRTGHRFAAAVLSSAWEGRTPFTEAMRMLGIKSMETLRSMSHRVAVYG